MCLIFLNSFPKIFIRMADNDTKSAPLMAAGRIDRRLKIVKIISCILSHFYGKVKQKMKFRRIFQQAHLRLLQIQLIQYQ